MRIKILSLLNSDKPLDDVEIKGWIKTRRDSKDFSFIEINDGSCLKNIQAIADSSLENYDSEIKRMGPGWAAQIRGSLVASSGKGQKWEIKAYQIKVLADAGTDYPLQKKRHTDEFLRTIAHLRARTNKYSAIFRIRSEVSLEIHSFFRKKGFKYINTPIITGSDCEGAGQIFRVNPLIDNFFGQEAYLTVSGQLTAEMLALALGDVYTFGPTFRAENSNTRRHAAEFWMIEPEMAFAELSDIMALSEEMIRHLTVFTMKNCSEDIELFAKFVDKNLMRTLKNIAENDFAKVSYKDALKILEKSGENFEAPVYFGADLQTPHEKYLTEKYFKKPLIVYDYPASIKPFYMRLNTDQETVAAMDVLVPGSGEIIGGSQREERLDILEQRIEQTGLNRHDYLWYLDSRRYGSVKHSGFGMGLERLIMLLTGVNNIRDVIPFPRTPGSLEF